MQYRLVNSSVHGYYVLYPDRESAMRRLNGMMPSDVLFPAKLQIRPDGIEGNDATWRDETPEPEAQP